MVRGVRCGFRQRPKTQSLLHAPTRHSVGYFGAVRLRDGKFYLLPGSGQVQRGDVLRVHERPSADMSIRTGRRVVVITDNASNHHHARLHKAWREEHTAGFTLDYLPPYSPELNPIERVWKLTRATLLAQSIFSRTGGGCRCRRDAV